VSVEESDFHLVEGADKIWVEFLRKRNLVPRTGRDLPGGNNPVQEWAKVEHERAPENKVFCWVWCGPEIETPTCGGIRLREKITLPGRVTGFDSFEIIVFSASIVGVEYSNAETKKSA
jgi:hypothetical protein